MLNEIGSFGFMPSIFQLNKTNICIEWFGLRGANLFSPLAASASHDNRIQRDQQSGKAKYYGTWNHDDLTLSRHAQCHSSIGYGGVRRRKRAALRADAHTLSVSWEPPSQAIIFPLDNNCLESINSLKTCRHNSCECNLVDVWQLSSC